MKKLLLAVPIALLYLSSCEVEVRDTHHYSHARGWEHQHYPEHHEVYNHGYHHDGRGNEIKEHHEVEIRH